MEAARESGSNGYSSAIEACPDDHDYDGGVVDACGHSQ